MSKVVMLSGGVTSFEALRRILIQPKDDERVVALFADTQIEDEDTYRFLADIERFWPIVRIADGRNIWQVFRDEKFIGNHRVDICSRVLKRDLLDKWRRENMPEAVCVLGLDWSEPHRVERHKSRMELDGWKVEYPLCQKPYLLKAEYFSRCREFGIEPPRLYQYGFEHNNCGGACVKGGQGQWARLLATFPERYRWHEEQEELTRQVIGKDVSVLRDRSNGETKPLTLRDFRERIMRGQPPQDDLFSCNCMG